MLNAVRLDVNFLRFDTGDSQRGICRGFVTLICPVSLGKYCRAFPTEACTISADHGS